LISISKSIFAIILLGSIVVCCEQSTLEQKTNLNNSNKTFQDTNQVRSPRAVNENDSLLSVYSDLLTRIKEYDDSININLNKIKLINFQLRTLQNDKKNILNTKKISEKMILKNLAKIDSLMLNLERKHKLLNDEISMRKNKIDIDQRHVDELKNETAIYKNKITLLIREGAGQQKIQIIKNKIDSINKKIQKIQSELSEYRSSVINAKQEMQTIDDSLQSFADSIRGKYFDKQNLDSFCNNELGNIIEKSKELNNKKDSINVILLKLNTEKNTLEKQIKKVKKKLSISFAEKTYTRIKLKDNNKIVKNVKNSGKQWPTFVFIILFIVIIILILFYVLGKNASEKI